MAAPDDPAAPIRTSRLELVLLTASWLRAYVAGGRLPHLGFGDPYDFLSGSEYLVHLRCAQLDVDPAAEPWLLRAMVLRAGGAAVGHANFHAPPDERAMVEIGYRVLPDFRGRGLAAEAAGAMWTWAAGHGARVLRASVAPDNEASLTILRRAGFVQVGEQIDDVDGLELVLERGA